MLATNLFFPNPKPSVLHFPFPQPQIRYNFPSKPAARSLISLALLRGSNLLRFKPNPSLKARAESGNGEHGGGLGVNVDDLVGKDEFLLPVELSLTRTLPPALTLRHGVEKLREAIEELKLDPPRSSSGVLRFQVAVPPTVKAMAWIWCQLKSSSVFPQFYFSGKRIHQESDVLASGMGAAISFHGSSAEGCRLMARYLSIDSHLIRAYGFIGYMMSPLVEQHSGSFYFLIPQDLATGMKIGSGA